MPVCALEPALAFPLRNRAPAPPQKQAGWQRILTAETVCGCRFRWQRRRNPPSQRTPVGLARACGRHGGAPQIGVSPARRPLLSSLTGI